MLSFVIFFKFTRVIITQTLYFLYKEKITIIANYACGYNFKICQL